MAKIAKLERLANTGGNPAWSVTLEDGLVARTAPGSQVAYSIENSEYQDVDVDIEFNNAGLIIGIAL